MYMRLHKNPQDRFNGDFLTVLTGHVSQFLNDVREKHVEDVAATEMEILHNLDYNLTNPDRDAFHDDYVVTEGRGHREECHQF